MDLTDVEYKLDKVAYKLFKIWVKNASSKYPDLDFTIKDESVLVIDLNNSIEFALKTLFNEEHKKNREKKGFDIGFVLGFVKSNLNAHWFEVYITRRSEEYKQIIVLNSIKKYLNSNEIAKIHILDFYKELINQNINLKDYDVKVPEIQVDLKELKFSNSVHTSAGLEIIDTCIDKIRIPKIIAYANNKAEVYLSELDKHFTDIQIEKIIKRNET